MSTPAKKAKATRAKNLKIKLANEKKLSSANTRANTARNKLKYFLEGFKQGQDSRRD